MKAENYRDVKLLLQKHVQGEEEDPLFRQKNGFPAPEKGSPGHIDFDFVLVYIFDSICAEPQTINERKVLKMDIKEKIGEIAAKITGDEAMKDKFGKDPLGTVKELAGNIPPEQMQAIVEGVKTKISLDKLGGIGNIGGLFGK